MLGLDDLLVANLSVRMSLLAPDALRDMLLQLDRVPERCSLARYLHEQRILAPEQVQALHGTAIRRVRQLQEEAYLAVARSQGLPEPALQQVAAACARDGFAWAVGDVLVKQHGLDPAHHIAMAQDAARRFSEHERGVLEQNRLSSYGPTVQATSPLATSSDQHRMQALQAAAAGQLHNSGAYQNPLASGAHNPRGSHAPPDPYGSSAPVRLSAPPNNPTHVASGGPPGPDGEKTIELSAVPIEPPADPDRTITLPAGGLGLGDDELLGGEPLDAGRTMMFSSTLATPGAPAGSDSERTIALPPGAQVPPPPGPEVDPFMTLQTTGLGPGGTGPQVAPDATIALPPGAAAEASSQQIGPYQTLRELGRGNMGVVFLARAPQGQFVAIKVIQARADREMRARFEREIAVSRHIDHDHVIQVLDHGQLPDESSYLVMEYLEGQELRDVLKSRGPIPVDRALELLEQLGSGLAAVHEARIVHRDLKPENVQVVQRNGGDHLKLVDFGIARFLDQAEQEQELFVTMRGTLSGTPAYVAPEAVLDPEEIRQSHDVYAAGVIFYEMVTGQLPFPPGRTLRDMLTDTLHSRPRSLDEAYPGGAPFPAWVENLIRKLLEKDPMMRPQDGGQLMETLRDARAELEGRPQNGKAPSRRKGRVAAAQERKPGFTSRLIKSITSLFKRPS